MKANLKLSWSKSIAFSCVMASLVLGAGTSYAFNCKVPTGLKGTPRHTINFAVNSADIGAKHKEFLKSSAERYRSNPSVQVCIVGQADKTGDAAYNKKLALERAESVADYLKESGLASKKFQIGGRGEAFGDSSSWLLGKITDEDDASDRRVEVIFYR